MLVCVAREREHTECTISRTVRSHGNTLRGERLEATGMGDFKPSRPQPNDRAALRAARKKI